MNYRQFFGRKSDIVAEELVGKILVRQRPSGLLTATICQTGAYESGDINGARKGMLYAPGSIFLMPFRGHRLMNIATDRKGYASCVEIRKIQLGTEKINGPGAVTRAMEISEDLDGVLLGNELQIIDAPQGIPVKVKKTAGNADNCFGFYSLVK